MNTNTQTQTHTHTHIRTQIQIHIHTRTHTTYTYTKTRKSDEAQLVKRGAVGPLHTRKRIKQGHQDPDGEQRQVVLLQEETQTKRGKN